MRELILAVSYWLHLVATVIWIGGITFVLFIAIPTAKQVLGADAGKLMGEISKRFTPLANYSIIFIIVTGIALTSSNKWTWVLIVKHVLVLGMVVVHFYRGLILSPRIARTESVSQKSFLQKVSLNLIKVNFCLGMAVLLLSGITAVLYR
ncbi:MAG: DUF4149 domain-containing protein [Nitrospirae bacterium]|nr:DUF4149 domain-containing protein [Nitrospirota bacterium]